LAELAFSIVETFVDAVTLAAVAVAVYYIIRQKLNRIFDAKVELVMVYVAFLGGMLLELLRDFTTDPASSLHTHSEKSGSYSLS